MGNQKDFMGNRKDFPVPSGVYRNRLDVYRPRPAFTGTSLETLVLFS